MPDTTSSTELTSQYTAQVIGDLDRNAKEQERIGAEIDALQEQLNALRHDHAVLTSLHQALGVTDAAVTTKPAPTAVAAVPQQKTAAKATRSAASAKAGRTPKTTDAKRTRSRAKTADTAKGVAAKAVATPSEAKSTAKTAVTSEAKTADAKATGAKSTTADNTAARSTTAKATASRTTAAKKPAAKGVSGQPTLVELIRSYLTDQGEPRSAAEVSTALGASHPDRRIQTNVVRTTLENLVAKSHAHRAKQGTSVFYTATDAHKPAVKAPRTEEPVAASAG